MPVYFSDKDNISSRYADNKTRAYGDQSDVNPSYKQFDTSYKQQAVTDWIKPFFIDYLVQSQPKPDSEGS